MRQYWLRISLGALVIFGVGMVGVHVVREGRSKVHMLMNSADPISLPLAFVPFRLAGDKLGSIKHLRIDRSAPDRLDSIQLTVQLDSGALASRLQDCRLGSTDARSIGPQTSFLCMSQADSARLDLVPFGTVRFEPSGEARPLLLPAAMVREWHGAVDSAVQAARVGAQSAAQQARAAVAQTQALRVRHGNPAQVTVRGDSAGVAIESRSDGSRFTFRADSSSAFLSIRDARGRDVVLLQADSSGAVFKVNGDTGRIHPVPGH